MKKLLVILLALISFSAMARNRYHYRPPITEIEEDDEQICRTTYYRNAGTMLRFCDPKEKPKVRKKVKQVAFTSDCGK